MDVGTPIIRLLFIESKYTFLLVTLARPVVESVAAELRQEPYGRSVCQVYQIRAIRLF